jgi:hypothetical protein
MGGSRPTRAVACSPLAFDALQNDRNHDHAKSDNRADKRQAEDYEIESMKWIGIFLWLAYSEIENVDRSNLGGLGIRGLR